ncbi:hypothetical protein [Kibdelosporangium aridum]|nr:hypothetical protein [Kibdelosporangium aridum]
MARYAQERIQAQDAAEALRILDQMVADVDHRRRTVARLSGQQEREAHE